MVRTSVPRAREVVGDSWSALSGVVEETHRLYPLCLPSLLLAAVIGGYKWPDKPIGCARGRSDATESHTAKAKVCLPKGIVSSTSRCEASHQPKEAQTGYPSPLTDLQRDETKSGQPRKRGLRLAKAK
jgi:hypothetical protein